MKLKLLYIYGLKNKAMLAIGSSSSRTAASSVTTSLRRHCGDVTTVRVTSLRRQSFHSVSPSPLTGISPLSAVSAAAPPPAAAMSTSPTVTRSLSPLVGGTTTTEQQLLLLHPVLARWSAVSV